MEAADCQDATPLLFLQARLGAQLGLDVSRQRARLDQPEAVSNVFLDNLKSATPWVLKAVGVEYLLDQVEQGDHANVLHIATHCSNLMKVSENIVVRRMEMCIRDSGGCGSIGTADRREAPGWRSEELNQANGNTCLSYTSFLKYF